MEPREGTPEEVEALNRTLPKVIVPTQLAGVMAMKPEGSPDSMPPNQVWVAINVARKVSETPPVILAETVYVRFLNRADLDGFMRSLAEMRDKVFPVGN